MHRTTALAVTLVALLLLAVQPLSPRVEGAVPGAVIVSQLGFAPGDPKSAVLAVPAGTRVDLSFQVLEEETGEAVYLSQEGDIQPYPNGWFSNNGTGDTYLLDFTRWPAAPGRYVIEIDGARSFPFEISSATYDIRRVRPLEFFRIQQSGVSASWQSLDGEGSSHRPDHLDDARQATQQDEGGDDGPLIQQETVRLPDGRLDVSGGWFDDGSYNKYMGNTPWAAYLLLLTYEDFEQYWSGVDSNGNGRPDLLEYVSPALEWMLKMQHGDGSVYERVFAGFPKAHDGRPDLETDNVPGNADDWPLDTDRYADITAKSSYAMAAAYRVFGDPRYLDMAVQTWDWAFENQGRVKPQRYGGGIYFGDVETGLTLGAIELHRALAAAGAEPDPRYLAYARTHVQGHLQAGDWTKPSTWDYQQSYALMRYFELASPIDQVRIIDQLAERWDRGVQAQSRNAYRLNDEWLHMDFGQNDLSTSSAGDALWTHGRTGERKYYDYAVNQMAWVFGRNPFGKSWLASALVSDYNRMPHWRATADHAVEGVVVPGAADRDGNGLPDYTDTGFWAYSEPSINQQAMFIRVMSALYDESHRAP